MDLSDVQQINLSMLMTIRDAVKEDMIAACCTYGLHVDQACHLQELSIDQILAIVANVGEECLFPPRRDLIDLLKAPVALAGALASVHPPSKVAGAHLPDDVV